MKRPAPAPSSEEPLILEGEGSMPLVAEDDDDDDAWGGGADEAPPAVGLPVEQLDDGEGRAERTVDAVGAPLATPIGEGRRSL